MTSATLRATPTLRVLALLAVVLALLAAPAQAQTTYVVDSNADDAVTTSSTADGTLTLREAVTAANTNAPFGDAPAGSATGDLITFSGVSRIQLTLGELVITDDLVVSGDGTVEVGPQLDMRSRVFNVMTTESVSIADLTVRDGYTLSGDGGGVLVGAGADVTLIGVAFNGNRALNGGALYAPAGASVDISFSSFTLNRATATGATNGGGAIYSAGVVSLSDAAFTNNFAVSGSASGGAIYIAEDGTLTALGVPDAAGAAELRGGGASAFFAGNRAARAGGAVEVRDGAFVQFLGAAFDGNRAGLAPGNGGAIHITDAGTVDLIFGSVTNNVAFAEGGGLWNSATGTMTVLGTIISNNLARGAGADQGGGGVFSDGGDTTLDGVSITDNRANGAAGSGGGVFASGTAAFTLTNATISGNTATRAGGGIEVLDGTLSLRASTLQANGTGRSPGNGGGLHITGAGSVSVDTSAVSDNTAGNDGGGLWNSGLGTLTLTGTTVSGNTARRDGGGLYQADGASGSTTVTQSLLLSNAAANNGGGVFADGATVDVVNSTLAQNTARRGGGGASSAANATSVSFSSATIAGNTASAIGGGFYSPREDSRVALQNTLVGDNTGRELSGFYVSAGHNLVESRTGAGIAAQMPTDLYGSDPALGPLGDNGGPTLTYELLAGSPALDAGDTDLTVDQRGEPRVDPDDIGAYEAGAPPFVSALVISGVIDATRTGGTPKAVELYVLEDVADLSVYGFGSATNGGGTDGAEFVLSGSATAGDFLYIASEATQFTAWFGFGPTFTSSAAGINGDDAVEVFYDASGLFSGDEIIADTYGDITIDGSGSAWDYQDGWAYRVDGTGPDGAAFTVGNFTYSGANALDGETDNATAATPFPVGTYVPFQNAQAPLAAKTEAALGLSPVRPNPIRGRGTVRFAVAERQAVTVELYDVMGRRVQTLYTGTPAAEASVEVTVDAGALASGVYVVVLSGETVRETQRVTVAR